MTTISQQMPITLKKTAPATDKSKERELRKACHDFEAIMLKQMLDAMRKSVPKSGLLDNDSYANKMYQSMQDDELSQEMARGKGMGLGEVLYQQLSGHAKPIGK
ncbi:MAG: rod-binding protein [Desulfobulbaceae bacterium]|nr:rod-binding protein [Desulfobulbaceae bacterium]